MEPWTNGPIQMEPSIISEMKARIMQNIHFFIFFLLNAEAGKEAKIFLHDESANPLKKC